VLREAGDGDCNHDFRRPLRTPSTKEFFAAAGKLPTPTLFPDVPVQRDSGPDALLPPGSRPERVGIARLASSSPLADAKRGTEYFLLPVRFDLEPLRFRSCAVFLDGEPLPWL